MNKGGSQSLKNKVYSQIKENILDRSLNPGEKLNEKEISQELNVSRTPVREAFALLHQEGLVKIKQNKGAYVTKISIDDLIEILEIREVLEGLAVKNFTINATKDKIIKLKNIINPFTEDNIEDRIEEYNDANVKFHDFIINNSQNQRLILLYKNLYNHQSIAKELRVIAKTKRAKASLKEHIEIIELIEKKEEKKAEEKMKDHICGLINDILYYDQNYK